MRRLLIIVITGLIAAGMAAAQPSLLDAIRARGRLICGLGEALPGFSSLGADGRVSGFDADLCRAMAAAVLGDAGAVTFRFLSPVERFSALQRREVDVLVGGVTLTSSRESSDGLTFAPITFYDSQGLMVRADGGIRTLRDLAGQSICVQANTGEERNLADTMRALNLPYKPVLFETAEAAVAAYDRGVCAVYTARVGALLGRRTTLSEPAASTILEATIAKEPLAPALARGDARWHNAVTWIVFGLFNAEELGLTAANVGQAAAESADPAVRRLLGVDGQAVTALGLPRDAILQAIKQVGNYGEIYDRHFGPATPLALPRGLNRLYSDGGLIYGMPFR